MIKTYCLENGGGELKVSEPPEALSSGLIWLDLVHPSKEEEALAERLLGIDLPTREELKDIEPSSRLYVEDGAAFMTASLLWKAESATPQLADIAFILIGNRLVTIRYAEPRSFDLFAASLKRQHSKCREGRELLARLLETVVDRTAEILEFGVAKVDDLSVHVFVDRKAASRRPPGFLEDKLLDIASHHRLVSKARDSLVSLSRLVSFVRSLPELRKDSEANSLLKIVARDVQSLAEHAAFIANNITFMLDATLGLINVEQNAIIKIFSIASVVFLPPTLVASIYGMNFHFMPELSWSFGYLYAIAAMIVSAVVPFLFFRWKGWL
ncbi:magnesium transporter CorA family protein [Rhizobium halophytocola]|uniref:Magnesium transporter n=1 Tax=Rhizobium halophytocola TaxID=735519 RepID=A0ABS4DXM2_9HYPH|nr:magnesium transporter CorA family protein [Rhizobium halophytocola]MBP1850420.1 magnesium transporter [Rhizobium halophytocola]